VVNPHPQIEGLRVRLSRLRVAPVALLPLVFLVPLVFLAACSSAQSDAKAASALDGITVSGTFKAPKVTFKTKPLSVKSTTTRVVTAGKGAKLSKFDVIMISYAIFNGKNGKQLSSNFGIELAPMDLSSNTMIKGLNKGLTGQQVGSWLLVAVPPADAYGAKGLAQAGIGPTDTIVFLIDLVSARTPLAKAGGIAVQPNAGLPTVIVDGAKPAQITVPKTPAPTKLVVQPLIKGLGAVVKSGQSIQVYYTGVLWKDGKTFDASGDPQPGALYGGPVDVQIGTGKVIAGWDKGLVGQTVGSRILLIVPPAEGYGAKGSPPIGVEGSPPIGPKDTMVFVVEILSAT
jgi:peptidylprolyl isomerase